MPAATTTGAPEQKIKLTLLYRNRSGSEQHKDFTDPVKAFCEFYRMVHYAWRSPLISSDEIIGFFSHENVEWYMLDDDDGKILAYNRFQNWIRDNRINSGA